MAAQSFEDRMAMMEEIAQKTHSQDEFLSEEEFEAAQNEKVKRELLRDDQGRFVSKKHEDYGHEDDHQEEDQSGHVENKKEERQEDDGVDDQSQIDDFLSYEDLKSRKVRAKINGEEVLLDGEELLRKYQKEEAADKKFQEAAILQKQLAKEREELLQFQQKLIEQQNETVKAALKAKEPTLPEKDEEKELIDAILLGDGDKSVEKIREVVSKRAAAEAERLLSEKLSSQYTELEERAYRKAQQAYQEQAWQSRLNELAAEREDIIGDEFLVSVFDQKLNRLVQEHGANTATIKMAEREYDEWAASKGIKTKNYKEPEQQKQSQDLMAERKARAEQAKKLSVGQAASAKSSGEKKEEPIPTGSALVQEMARQRQPWRNI